MVSNRSQETTNVLTFICAIHTTIYELLLRWPFFFETESHPDCGIKQGTETSFLNGGDTVVLSCTLRYWGSEFPRMRWNLLNGMEIPSNQTIVESNRTVNILESSIRLTAKSEFLTQSPIVFTFTMVYFASSTSDGIAEGVDEQIRPSEYQFVWSSPKIFKGFREYHIRNVNTLVETVTVNNTLSFH